MGGCSFSVSARAKKPADAYEELVNDAIYMYGHNPYNGTISTCDMGRCTLSFPNYKKENIDEAYRHIEERDFGNKWVADYIDLGKCKDGMHEYLFYGIAAC